MLACCPSCESCDIDFKIDLAKKKGLSVLLEVNCNKCDWDKNTYTSRQVSNDSCDALPFEINMRTIIAMREIGKGHTALEKLCGFMNLTPPMKKNAFNKMQKTLYAAYKDVAEQSMNEASAELREDDGVTLDENGVGEITVSCDGTWQRRGYSSFNGVSADNSECLDARVMPKVCHECSYWEKLKPRVNILNLWKSTTAALIMNGSSGSTEAAGLVQCFAASEKDHQFRYKYFIGDGESKSHVNIVEKDPYDGIVVEKLECVGHIQKRVGGRLRKLKATNKERLSDGKTLGGKGRLTEKVINKLQNYFGIAVRQSTGKTVYDMKKAIGAVIFHCSDANDPEVRHRMCLRSHDTWCTFQADKINGTSKYALTNQAFPQLLVMLLGPFLLV